MEWTGLAIQCSSLRYEMIAARAAGFACRRHSGARDDRLRVHQPCIERVVVPDEISRREIRRIVVTVGLAGSAANDVEQGRPLPRRDFIGEPSVSPRRLRLAGTKTTPNNSSRQLLQITKCMFH